MISKRYIFVIFIITLSIKTVCQKYNNKTRYFIGTFHTQNTTINGISFGAFPQFNNKSRFVKTNGIRLEIPGIGFFAPLGNGSPISRRDEIDTTFNSKYYPYDEIVNGINISTGTVGEVMFNGITIGLIAQFGISNNGIAIAGLWNAMNTSDGIQISVLLNETLWCTGIQVSAYNSALVMKGFQLGVLNYGKEMNGIQIGLFNKSSKTRGIQIGIWNINEKRKLPLINWNFTKSKQN